MKTGRSHVKDETPEEEFSFSFLKKNNYKATITAVETEHRKIIISIAVANSREDLLKESTLPKVDVENEDLNFSHYFSVPWRGNLNPEKYKPR